MFTGKVDIKCIRSGCVDEKLVRELNRLCHKQHSDSHPVTVEGLKHRIGKGLVLVVAFQDARAMGFAFGSLETLLAHSVLTLHSIMVMPHHDEVALGKQLYEELLAVTKGWVYDYVDAECWADNESSTKILEALGFRQRQGKLKFRLKR